MKTLLCVFSDIHLSRAQKSCIVGLIQHLHLNDDGMKIRKFQLRNYKSAGYMYLNSAAVKALELFGAYQEDGIFCSFSLVLLRLYNCPL